MVEANLATKQDLKELETTLRHELKEGISYHLAPGGSYRRGDWRARSAHGSPIARGGRHRGNHTTLNVSMLQECWDAL